MHRYLALGPFFAFLTACTFDAPAPAPAKAEKPLPSRTATEGVEESEVTSAEEATTTSPATTPSSMSCADISALRPIAIASIAKENTFSTNGVVDIYAEEETRTYDFEGHTHATRTLRLTLTNQAQECVQRTSAARQKHLSEVTVRVTTEVLDTTTPPPPVAAGTYENGEGVRVQLERLSTELCHVGQEPGISSGGMAIVPGSVTITSRTATHVDGTIDIQEQGKTLRVSFHAPLCTIERTLPVTTCCAQ